MAVASPSSASAQRMTDPSFSSEAPHLDQEVWTQIIETLESGSILVAISARMGPKLRAQVDLEDIWQETLCQAWRDRMNHEWRGLRAYRSWILVIAKHRIYDAAERAYAVKRGNGRVPISLTTLAGGDDDEYGSVHSMLPPRLTTPSIVAQRKEVIQAMDDALAALPDDLRPVVQLRLFEQLKIREVAEQLELLLPTAKTRLYRGANLFRRELNRRLMNRWNGRGRIS